MLIKYYLDNSVENCHISVIFIPLSAFVGPFLKFMRYFLQNPFTFRCDI